MQAQPNKRLKLTAHAGYSMFYQRAAAQTHPVRQDFVKRFDDSALASWKAVFPNVRR